eukprot:2073389-Alexandrium_andersonii.AAC.1
MEAAVGQAWTGFRPRAVFPQAPPAQQPATAPASAPAGAAPPAALDGPRGRRTVAPGVGARVRRGRAPCGRGRADG